jgi:hypothetical protein
LTEHCEKFKTLMSCATARALVVEYKALPLQRAASLRAFTELLTYAQTNQPTICRVAFKGVPYQTYEQMKSDVTRTGVYEAGSGLMFPHPFWTSQDMGEYMAWHDVLGHMSIDADFSPDGESEVFAHHARELLAHGKAAAVDALALEILYRIAWIVDVGWTWEYKPVLPGTLGRALIHNLLRSV